jgi:hypothetical protein
MAADRKQANMKALSETADIQEKTKETIFRIQRTAAETEAIGAQTLDELRRQGAQMDDVNAELDSVSSKLDQSQALQSRFDRWAGNWLGIKKGKALKEAANEIAERNQTEYSKIKEVFQHEKFDGISRTWKKAGLVLCSDPSISCDDVFDPAEQASLTNSKWQVDFSLAGIDMEGWTYAYDFARLNKVGAGDPAPKWDSYVRRRKWRYVESTSRSSGAVSEVSQRNEERKNKAAASRQADKFGGYVSRNKNVGTLQESGLTSTSLTGGRRGAADQELDAESAAGLARVKETDAEIDAGIDAISRTMDNISNMSAQMRDETATQNVKLEKMDENMNRAMQKQTVVNARQRQLLK